MKHDKINRERLAEPGGTPSIRGYAAGQGMVFVVSVLNRIYKFARVCPKRAYSGYIISCESVIIVNRVRYCLND